MLAAQSAAPISSDRWFSRPVYRDLTEKPVTVVQSPPGYFLADELADFLRRQKIELLWLRFDQDNRDPARILLSLIGSAQRKKPDFGSQTLKLMKSRPGPIYGWTALYQSLGEELDEELPVDCAIVLEHIDLAHNGLPSFQPLLAHLLGNKPANHIYILTSHTNLPKSVLPATAAIIGSQDLQINTQAAKEMAKQLETDLPAQAIRRMIDLLEGREVPVRGAFQACSALGSARTERLIRYARDGKNLQSRLAEALLNLVRPEEMAALSLARQLPYSHPTLLRAVLGSSDIAEGPWLQSLEGDWARLRTAWQPPLRSTLADRLNSDPVAMYRAAEFFSDQAEPEIAVQILLDQKDFPGAAELITRVAEPMIDLGQWATLEGWLSRIPEVELANWPWLSYVRAELCAASVRLEEARTQFMISYQSFLSHFHPERACQSLLAASFLAAKQGRSEEALSCALRAEALVGMNEIPEQRAWINYQLGCLVAQSGDQNAALGFLSQAVEQIQDPQIGKAFQQAGDMAARRRQLDVKKSQHLQALDEIAREEQDLSMEFQRWVGMPFEDLPGILSDWGWFKTPLALKAACLPWIPTRSARSHQNSPWGKWLSRLRSKSSLAAFQMDVDRVSPRDLAVRMDALRNRYVNGEQDQQTRPLSRPETSTASGEQISAGYGPDSIPKLLTEHGPPLLHLSAFMLGPFRLELNFETVAERTGGRGLAMLKYLLAHHGQVIPREVLMETFWPEVNPEAARNNLNVAMHSLRQLLRSISEEPVIVYMFGKYTFSEETELWIDIDEFNRHIKMGQQLMARNQIEAAVNEFEVAVTLYQGDFLAEDPYEEWTILPRERTRLAYLDLLDQLGQIYFSQERYMTCASICQRMLERDNCREDAHRRLMVCYARQGQTHLALRQYQVCVEALRIELDIEPEPATEQLADQIRQRKPIDSLSQPN